MTEPIENNPFEQEEIRNRINEETARWLSSIQTQRVAQSVSANYITEERSQNYSGQANVQIVQNKSTSGSGPIGQVSTATAGASNVVADATGGGGGGDGGGLPTGAIAKQFSVCENGQTKTYWFVVWENEPDLTASEE